MFMRRDDAVIHHDGVPAFAPAALETLYGSLYCSLPAMQQAGNRGSTDICTYVTPGDACQPEQAEALLMFRREAHVARVINEGMQLSRQVIDSFCTTVFDAFPDIRQIEFNAIPSPSASRRAATPPPSYPLMQWVCTEDILITLPDTGDAYLSRLGKSMRKSLKRHQSRAERGLTGFSHQLRSGPAIDESDIRAIAAFNQARMIRRQREPALNESSIQELLRLMRSHGHAGILRAGPRLCAGTLCCRLGDDVFSLVNAHDPAFDHLGLGHLSRHRMILWAIKTGARRFHLLGGNFQSKRAALGERQALHHLTVYRTHRAMLRDAGGIARHAAQACTYRLHCWLEDQRASGGRAAWGHAVGRAVSCTLSSTLGALRTLHRASHAHRAHRVSGSDVSPGRDP